MKYNERIREIREDCSLTQQKIADLLHIGQRTYADYESGKTRIPVDNTVAPDPIPKAGAPVVMIGMISAIAVVGFFGYKARKIR